VSPSWRECARIWLHPDGVRVARHGRGFTPTIRSVRAVACARDAADDHAAALDALRRALGAEEWHGARAAVALSGHYTCLALVPDAHRLRGADEMLAAARHQLTAIYGEAAAAWRVAMSPGGRAGAGVAAGVDGAFVDAIVETLDGAGLRIDTLEPIVAVAFARLRGAIGNDPAWFAVVEPRRVAIGHVSDGAWRLLRTDRLEQASAEHLSIVLDRCRLASGVEAAAGRVLVAAIEPFRPTQRVRDWTFEPVPIDAFGHHR